MDRSGRPPPAFEPGCTFFIGAVFGDEANFHDVAFGTGANFTGATFGELANFFGATFGNWAHFAGAAFGNRAIFIGAAFGDEANFTGAIFGDSAFAGAAFGMAADFSQTHFKGLVDFTGKSEAQWIGDIARIYGEGTEARVALKQRHEESWKRYGSGPDRFMTISFERARFDGKAIFSGRSFEHTADFIDVRFYYPLDLYSVTNVTWIDFTGAYIGFVPPGKLHWTSETKIPIRLRAFRKIAEETKNHDLERDLYIEERKAERGVYWRQLLDELKKAPEELKKRLEDINNQKTHVWLEWRLQRRARNAHWLGIAVKIARLFTHLLWIAVMGVYWALADYGRSVVRPLAWLIVSGFFFYWRYLAVLAQLMAKAPDIDKYKQAVRMLALGNTVPFVGPLTIDGEIKKLLFCPDCADKISAIPPEGYQLLVLGQNLLSITLVFFIGLALRNYFRIK